MARNRKLQSAAVRFGPALKALLLCLLIGGSGVGYVWQKEQIVRLDRRIKTQELHLVELRNRNDLFRKQLNALRSFSVMQQRIKDFNLGLVEPLPAQKWRLTEPVPEPPQQKQLAQAGRASR